MIRLKNILSEIDTSVGDLNKYTGEMIFEEIFFFVYGLDDFIYLKGDGFIFVGSKSNEINRVMLDAAKKNKKMPKEIRDRILKPFGKIVRSTRDVVITLQEGGEFDYMYHMFDFSKPVKLLSRTDSDDEPIFEINFYVGNMFTEKTNRQFYYSPKKQLGLSNIQQVHLSQIGTEHRGQGYGAMLYDTVAGKLDAIYSDAILYKGAIAMWTNHMRKKSKFFGAILSDEEVIVPISGEIDKKVINTADGFVSIFKNVPPKLKEMEQFLSGIPIDNIYVSYQIANTDVSLKRMTDTIDDSVTLAEFNKAIFDEDLSAKYTAGIFLHSKTTFVVKEVGEELDYMII